jgi:hypothetical protein
MTENFAEELAKLTEHPADPVAQVRKRRHMQKQSVRVLAKLIPLKE